MKQHKVTWYVTQGCASTCGVVRGDQVAVVLNKSEESRWEMNVKTSSPLFSSDLVFPPRVAVIQRELDALPFMSMMKSKGTKIVYDIDDALWLLPENDKAPEYQDFLIKFDDEGRNRLKQHLDISDAITVSTPELQQALKDWHPKVSSKVTLIQNGVSSATFPYFPNDWHREVYNVLWYGAGGHHFNMKLLDEVARRVLLSPSSIPIVFTFMGSVSTFKEVEALKEQFPDSIKTRDWVPYGDLGYMIAVADCVACPIIPHPFTICKSEIKALEVASCGRWPLMAKVPQYVRFAEKVLDGGSASELVLPTFIEGDEGWNDHVITRWSDQILKLAGGHVPMDVGKMIEKTLNTYYMDRPAKRWDKLLTSLL